MHEEKKDRDNTYSCAVAVFIRGGQILLVYNEFGLLSIDLYDVDGLARKRYLRHILGDAFRNEGATHVIDAVRRIGGCMDKESPVGCPDAQPVISDR